MSKSLGNVVDPIELADVFGVDQLRYFLLREVSFGSDGSYSEEAIVTRCNADLANNFGNLVQRSLSMIAKNCEGRVPPAGTVTPAEDALLAAVDAAQATVMEAFSQLALQNALEVIWSAMSNTNLYFADQAPWAVRKTDPARADTILYYTAEAIRKLAIMASWAIPTGAGEVLDLLGQKNEARNFSSLATMIQPGLELPAPSGVFPRLELAA
jgi:methionyl-tRNA synthetase